MYPSQKNLAQEVKKAVLAELQQENYTNPPQFSGHSNLRYGTRGQWDAYTPYTADQTYQAIKDSVKNEVLADIQTQQVDKMARTYGLDRTLSDQKVQQMVDARYRTIENLKADLKRELLALQEIETRRTRDPYIRQTAYALAEEARRQGIPREQLIRNLDQKTAKGAGLMEWLSETLNTGQRKGFLCGVGMMILCQLILPSARNNMRSVAVRSLEEGMAMVDRAKVFVRGHTQQNPPTDATSPDPEPPAPEGNYPPSGGEA